MRCNYPPKSYNLTSLVYERKSICSYMKSGENDHSVWGRVTHICGSDLSIIGSDNGLSPGWRQAITWTNAGILLLGSLRTNFNEIFIEIHMISVKKIHLKMSSGKWRPFCLLTHCGLVTLHGDIELSQYWLMWWLVAWRHYAIIRTDINLSWIGSCGAHLMAIFTGNTADIIH